jgi:hypothetical protein
VAAKKTKKSESSPVTEVVAAGPALAHWSFVTTSPTFDPARNMLQVPMEITRSRIRVIRMIDESVIVHGRPAELDSSVGKSDRRPSKRRASRTSGRTR